MASVVSLIRSSVLASAPYAYAATVPPGSRLIFLAGSCPLNADGVVVARGDYAGQAGKCITNLQQILLELGADLSDVVTFRVLVASSNRADLSAAWRVVADAFGGHDAPSTLMGVTALGYEHQLVEVEVTIALPS